MDFLEAYANFAGKVAAVIGGAGGVGRAITLALAKAGTDIATCDSDDDAAQMIVGETKALGRKILSMPADVHDPAALDRFYDRVENEFERLDIVVNVAGGTKRLPFLQTTREQHAAEIRLNFGYVIDSVQRAIPLIRRGGRGGSIINFTTIEAYRGAATFSVYAGAKAANGNFSRAMAVELAAQKIRVNVIAPDTTPSRTSYNAMSAVDRARFERLPPDVLAQGYNIYIPQKQPPTEEDLANAVLFLASDLARAITGITLHVDGGTMAASGFLDWPFDDGYAPAPLAGTLRAMFEDKK
jgi:NAD(P)-dependent dehydrogenase (short-subunit alcohol dehydrogenase family)